jgi:DNA repair exonuclease SbcCD ATPase subunit
MIIPTERDLPADENKPVTEEYIEAFNLDLQIRISGQAAQQNLYDMCMGLKTMHDKKLYKELGFSSFEKYAEERHGFTKQQGLRLIRAVETYSKISEKVTPMLPFDNSTKYFLLSTLSEEDRDKIAETTDLENTTVRELKGRIKDLEKQADNAQAIADKLTKSENKAWGEVSKLKTDNEARQERIAQLEREIKELESRPIEMVAAPPDSDEVRRLKQAMSNLSLQVQEDEARRDMEEKEFRDSFRAKMEADRDSAIAKYEAKRSAELEALKKELEQAKAQLSETPAADDKDKQDFKALLTNAVDSVKRLNDFVKAHDNEIFRQKLSQLAAMIGG